MIWLLANWKIVGAGALSFIVAYMLHSLDVNRLENQYEDKLSAAVRAEQDKCKADKQLTINAEKNYEDKIGVRDADIKRLHDNPPKCVPITKRTSGGNAADRANQPDTGNGVTSNALYDFASECETDRIKVITLQDFIMKVWATNNQ